MNREFEWLNENSRKFLNAGYLTGNQTAEERVREIANIITYIYFVVTSGINNN